jgi:hypothetical protein
MSKDWNADESPEVLPDEITPEGEESSPPSSWGGGRATKLSLVAVVAAGLVLTFKGTRLSDRFWPGSPQRASAVMPSAAPTNVITITRPETPAKKHPPTTPAAPPSAPESSTPVPSASAPPSTQPAPPAVALTSPAPAAPTSPRPTPIAQPTAPRPATLESRRLAPAFSTLDTLRGHLQLYALQHGGKPPEFARYPAWHQLTQHTRADGTVDPQGEFGPYVEAAPANPLNDSVVIGLTRRTPEPGKALKTGGKIGWVYCVTTGMLYATDADGKTVLAERDSATATAR